MIESREDVGERDAEGSFENVVDGEVEKERSWVTEAADLVRDVVELRDKDPVCVAERDCDLGVVCLEALFEIVDDLECELVVEREANGGEMDEETVNETSRVRALRDCDRVTDAVNERDVGGEMVREFALSVVEIDAEDVAVDVSDDDANGIEIDDVVVADDDPDFDCDTEIVCETTDLVGTSDWDADLDSVDGCVGVCRDGDADADRDAGANEVDPVAEEVDDRVALVALHARESVPMYDAVRDNDGSLLGVVELDGRDVMENLLLEIDEELDLLLEGIGFETLFEGETDGKLAVSCAVSVDV